VLVSSVLVGGLTLGLARAAMAADAKRPAENQAGNRSLPGDAADRFRPATISHTSRPNVVLIMTDDQGYGDLGVMGNPVLRTPNIDRLAGQSAWMTQFYVSPVCAPTRACLMTGRYNYRTRCIDTYIGRAMMDPSEVTLAEMLGQAGYATGIFGKWHLGDNYPLRAMDQGFDESLVHRGGGIGQPSDPPGGEGKYTNPILFHNGRQEQRTGFCTDIYFHAALDFIDACRKKEKNFFVYIPTNAPHTPLADVPPDRLREYRAKDLRNERFPQAVGHPLPKKTDTDRRARIYAMIANIDENVGRLLDKLDAWHVAGNTIVLFLVDNGPNGRRYVAGMRGMKTEVYEGGIRSPLFVRWPDQLKAGTRSDRIAAHIDIVPTLLDACGVAAPKGVKLDGRSLMPLLRGSQVAWPDRMIVLQSHRGNVPVRYHQFAARNQRWKLLHASGFARERFEGPPRFELYDMRADPLEMHEMARDRPEVVAAMRRAYDRWFDDVSSTRPDNYAPPRIIIGSGHENPVVLTRQNWRHLRGVPWGRSSNGAWQLHVARAGRYDVRLRFRRNVPAGPVTLSLGAQTRRRTLRPGETEVTFKDVVLDVSDTRLMATLTAGESMRGPWQVDVWSR